MTEQPSITFILSSSSSISSSNLDLEKDLSIRQFGFGIQCNTIILMIIRSY